VAARTNPTVVPAQPSGASFEYRQSYWKTIVAAGLAALGSDTVLLVLARIHLVRLTGHAFVAPIVVAAWVLGLVASVGGFAWTALVFAGGLIAIRRDALEVAGRPYAPKTPRESQPGRLGNRIRSFVGLPREGQVLRLRPGEQVEIKNLEAILATLDASGTLDGLPFMPEMAAYCGQRTTVFRRVDKLNDWIHHEGLKRAHDMVQLTGLRCTGTMHGGCQANCRLRWKEAWLRRVNASRHSTPPDAIQTALVEADLYRLSHRTGGDGQPGYMCQATELASGTGPPIGAEPGHVIRDFTTGNVRLRPLLTGVAIACFNWVQTKRSGAAFPYMEPSTSKNSPSESLGLRAGELVRVKPRARIEKTLNERNRNRGLSFDREMLRFCGGEYRVAAVLERVIVEATGTLKELTIPCIVLEGVTATGEYRGFNPEDEHIFWREIWLERVNPTAPS